MRKFRIDIDAFPDGDFQITKTQRIINPWELMANCKGEPEKID